MYKAVVVDDEYYVRYGLEHTIAWDEYGIELVASAANGVQALAEIHRHRPQLVITDVKMPGMTGLQLLKEIRHHYPKTKVIVVSGFDDFDYVKECLVYGVENYILKPIDPQEISQTISTAIAKLESEEPMAGQLEGHPVFIADNILLRLVTDSITVDQAVDRFKRLEIDINAESYAVVVIRVLQNEDVASRQVAAQSITHHCRHKIAGQAAKVQVFGDLSSNVVQLFCNGPEDTLKSVEKTVRRCVESITDELGLDIFAAIGSIENGLPKVNKSYALAESILDYSYLYPPNSTVTYNTIQKTSAEVIRLFNFDHDTFRTHVQSNSRDEITKFFRNVHGELITTGRYPPVHVRSYLIELTAGLIALMREKKAWKENDVVAPHMLYDRLFMRQSFGDVIVWLEEITLTFMARLADRAQRPKDLAERTIDYVRQHSDEEISLKTIAAEFEVNPSYLGRMLKIETGELFTDYLNELRIDRAKVLLRTTQKKANVVAREVGYSDSNYFYRVFRKYTGEYPTAFRKHT